MRSYNRSNDQYRPFSLETGFTMHAEGSVLITCGNTKVLCNATIENKIPPFLRNSKTPSGWVTAEYSMLPRSTNTRNNRDSRNGNTPARSIEIQRLISRSLRSAIDLSKIPEISILLDCDVIQADGSTRTTSITGAYVSLAIAVNKLIAKKQIKENPLTAQIAALAVGIKDGQVLCDLDYEEDSNIDADINIVFNDKLEIIEIQGTAEKATFSRKLLNQVLDLVELRGPDIFAIQKEAIAQSVQ